MKQVAGVFAQKAESRRWPVKILIPLRAGFVVMAYRAMPY